MIYNFSNAYEVPNKPASDRWYKKLILRVYGSVLPFQVGDKVLIQSDRYNGVHEIGYIYRGVSAANGSFWNLYFEIPFAGDTTGTVDTAGETILEKPVKTLFPVDINIEDLKTPPKDVLIPDPILMPDIAPKPIPVIGSASKPEPVPQPLSDVYVSGVGIIPNPRMRPPETVIEKVATTAEKVVEKVASSAETAVKNTTAAISSENPEEKSVATGQVKKYLVWAVIIIAGLIVYKKFIKK